jgi:hemoglobin
MSNKTLYELLGGYDAISAVANDLLPRLQADPQMARYWRHRGEDGVNREKQLLIDFLCSSAGGPLYYTGRDMKTAHKGMKISESDWAAFLGHVNATLEAFKCLSLNATRWSRSCKAQNQTSSKHRRRRRARS